MTTNFFNWDTIKRRSWLPNNPAQNSERSSASKSISRCLALTNLEAQVQNYLTQGIDRADSSKLSTVFIENLQHNITDEDNHLIALTKAKEAMVDYTSVYDTEANQIIKAWSELPDNPITAAAVLELGVFFVILPIYAQYGGISLKITGNSISGDERNHVVIHREAAMLLGDKPSKQLKQLTKETVRFIAQDLSEETNNRWSIDRCLSNSLSLLSRGVSDMLETKAAMVNSPFEIANNKMDTYV